MNYETDLLRKFDFCKQKGGLGCDRAGAHNGLRMTKNDHETAVLHKTDFSQSVWANWSSASARVVYVQIQHFALIQSMF